MFKNKINIIISLTTFILIFLISFNNTVYAQQKNIQEAAGIYSYADYPSGTKAKPDKKVKHNGWKLVGTYPQPVNTGEYIKKPYHNPKLIQELAAQKAEQERLQKELEIQKSKERQEMLKQMVVNAARCRRQRYGYMHSGPTVVTPRKVSSRSVASLAEYRNAARNTFSSYHLINSGL
ncbi:MAG: hypothetical protein AB1782_02920 [Cyanobacteriota bacterium]